MRLLSGARRWPATTVRAAPLRRRHLMLPQCCPPRRPWTLARRSSSAPCTAKHRTRPLLLRACLAPRSLRSVSLLGLASQLPGRS
eukprot:3813119-Alexandrium_andersonii.AAC.1